MWPRCINYSVYSIENALAIGLWQCFYWSASSLFNYDCKIAYIFKCTFLFVTFLWTLTTVTFHTQPDTYLCYWIKYSILTYVVLPGEKEEMSIYRSSADTWVIQWFKCKQSTNIYIYIYAAFLTGETTILMTRFCQS